MKKTEFSYLRTWTVPTFGIPVVQSYLLYSSDNPTSEESLRAYQSYHLSRVRHILLPPAVEEAYAIVELHMVLNV